ncbi:trehalose-phosphatase [Halobacteria archaeon AArc-dxtr1]|nr:trehalose-phosphatase [Halobacteria archaeon AArc-dxtr1]
MVQFASLTQSDRREQAAEHEPTRPLASHRDRLAQAISAAESVVLCLDFDGTLAPIVEEPDAAEPIDGAVDAVQTLEALPDVTTAIVSGRALDDVRDRIDGPSIYAGNHGLEIERDGRVAIHPVAADRAETVDEVCARLDDQFDSVSGCRIENKRLTGTVHFRSVPETDRETIVERTTRTVERVGGDELSWSRGRRIIEFTPDVSWGKGGAVEVIASGVVGEWPPDDAAVLYVGDDTTDESAFDTVEPHGIGVRVGSTTASNASCHVESPTAVVSLLEWLAQARS